MKKTRNFGYESDSLDRRRNLLICTKCLRKSFVFQLPQHQWNSLQHKWIIHPSTQCTRGLTTVTVYSDGVVSTISVWWKLMSFIACFYISSQQESLKFEIWSLTSNLSPGSFPRGISPSFITILPRDGQCSSTW